MYFMKTNNRARFQAIQLTLDKTYFVKDTYKQSDGKPSRIRTMCKSLFGSFNLPKLFLNLIRLVCTNARLRSVRGGGQDVLFGLWGIINSCLRFGLAGHYDGWMRVGIIHNIVLKGTRNILEKILTFSFLHKDINLLTF